MENNENKPNNEHTTNQECRQESCCSGLFSTYDSEGRKKPSAFVWGVLIVVIIASIGIASSKRQNQREFIKNTNQQAIQLQRESDSLETRVALKNKAQESKKAKEAKKQKTVEDQIKEMQQMHNKEMMQAQKAFENLRAAYSQKLNQVMKDIEAKEEANKQNVPNPELNFQLRGLSNVKVQFNKAKDISYIEIIQPENNKSCGENGKNKQKCPPQKEKGCEEKSYNKTGGDCKPKGKWGCYENSGYVVPMPNAQDRNQNKWDCNPQAGTKSGCGTY